MTDLERQEKKDRYIQYFRDVPIQKYGAMYIGVTEQTIINWLKEDDVFFNRQQEARADWVKKKATKVKAEFALERLEKEIWAERKEIVVNDPRKEILKQYELEDSDVGEAPETPSESPEDTA